MHYFIFFTEKNKIAGNETYTANKRLKCKLEKIMKYKLLSILILSLTLVSCKLTGIRGNGDLISETRDVEEFQKIDVSGNYEVEITVGEETSLKIIAESNLMKYIKTKVKKNTLFISSRENLRPREDLKLIVSVSNLTAIECSGVNEILAEGINSEEFYIDLSGAGSIDISGQAGLLRIDVSGAADLMAKDFLTEDITIDVSGAANAEVYASNSCDAEVSGAGYIELYGEARDVNMDVSGAGSLERK